MKVLIIEDEISTRELIKKILKEQNFILFEAENGKNGIMAIKELKPDIVILDLNLPDENGFNICSMIRNHPDIFGLPAIIILTVEKDPEQLYKGLSIGADDYIKKPFDYNEFLLRILALARRIERSLVKIYNYGLLTLDVKNLSVYSDSKQILLNRKEFELLHLFILNKGILLSREKIMEQIWNKPFEYRDRTIDVTIKRLKDKISFLEDKIQSIRSIGYKLKNL